MKYLKLFLSIVLYFPFALYAQDVDFTISGNVVDENNQPVPFANAALYSETDSTLLTGSVSDDEGNFSIAAANGKYILRITFLSYEEKSIPVTLSNTDFAVGKVVLSPGSQILESVTIEGEVSQMELHLDRRVFQVGKDLSNISGSAADILDNIPSVAVDVEGNISLRGSQNVRILIDGRPSGLTGISPADALRQMQGNMIERVEIITNPSARYDAEGEVGIINIILKKEKQKGVNGTFTFNGGYPENFGGSFNLNVRRKNVNFFTSYGINYRSGPGSGFSLQTFSEKTESGADTSFYYRQNTDRERSDLGHNFRGGMDYYINEKTILTGSFVIRKSESVNKSNIEYFDFDENDSLVGRELRKEHEKEPETNSEISLSFKKDFQKKDQQLTADFKYIDNQETERATFVQTDFFDATTLNQRSVNTENERNILAQVDYVHPFGSKGRIEAGLKSTTRVIDNDFQVDSLVGNEEWATLSDYNNHLIYDEKIHAGYFIIGNERGNISWQTGLRGEFSDIEVELAESDERTRQDYFNVFPSAHLSYRFDPKRTIQLSYSYRLSRPRFRDLMPFSNYSDIRSVSIGNPQLRPEYTHSTELGYLLNFDNGSLLSSVYYRHRMGLIERINLIDSALFTRSFPVNLGTEDSYGFEFNFSWDAAKWWRLNTNANVFRAITEGTYNDQFFSSDTYTWSTRTTSNLTFFKKYDFQVSYNYRGPRQTTQGRDKSMYFIDLGLSRDFLKGNASVTLAVRDLLNSRKFRSVIVRPDEGYYSEREFQGRVRQFLITLSYRLNSNKESRNRDNNNNNNNEGGGEFEGGVD
jgi:outer membrane receptor protein involved in Fe transport